MNNLKPWSTTAINLPDHANNPVHTDAGARAAGFERALVAGTSVYAYMTHPVVTGWGIDWLTQGGGELRLRRPVFDQDTVDCTIGSSDDHDGPVVSAEVAGDVRATLAVWQAVTAPVMRDGEPLAPLSVALTDDHISYGVRAGDDHTIYAENRIVPPVTWTNLANEVFMNSLVTGPWVHVRSKIFHQALARVGDTVAVESTLVKRFDSRAGERALVDMRFCVDGTPVCTVEHEAIMVLTT
jgi:acyl dehydratase